LNHYADPDFWEAYHRLPDAIRELADKNFALLKADPSHPSLRFNLDSAVEVEVKRF